MSKSNDLSKRFQLFDRLSVRQLIKFIQLNYIRLSNMDKKPVYGNIFNILGLNIINIKHAQGNSSVFF